MLITAVLTAVAVGAGTPSTAMPASPATTRSLPHGVPVASDFPYPEVAARFQERWLTPVGTELGTGQEAVHTLLDRAFVRLPIGLFDLRYPVRDLSDRARLEQLQTVAGELLAMQNRFVHWTQGTRARSNRSARPDIGSLSKWMRQWKSRDFKDAEADAAPRELLELLDADEGIREACQDFASFMRSGECLGSSRPEAEGLSLVLTPSREEFVGFACLVGSLIEAARPTLWTESIPQWTVFQWAQTQVLALEYSHADADAGSYTRGTPMDSREKTGLEQHVVHHAMIKLCSAYFGEGMDPAVESGLATNMVIDLYGQDNARVGGAEAGNKTPSRSKFVAGGQSHGGKFPRINADSRWRAEKGKDYFRRALKKAQEDGLDHSEDPSARRTPEGWMLLQSASRSDSRLSVRAPFLGDEPGTAALSDDYRQDALEFFRAYGAGFVYWLRNQKGEGDAAESFARLLREAAANREDPVGFSELTLRVYGMPLSGPARDPRNLEWSFLRQLAR